MLRRLFCLGALLSVAAGGFTLPAQALPRSEKELRSITDNLTKTTVTYGQIPALLGGQYLSVGDAAMTLEDRDPVFIVFFPTGPRIYPQKILVWHEVINETLEGHAYCVTYCPITGSLAAYDAQVDGVNLTFDNEGRLYNNNSVLMDRNTGSFWLQLIGMAFDGPLAGKGLNMLPVWWSTWEHVRKIYPKALVLGTPRGTYKPYGRDPYGSYFAPDSYYNDEKILYPLLYQDRRMHPKTRVIGLECGDLMLAVDENHVKQQGVVNFFVGPDALVAIRDPRLDVVRIFNRQVWDRPLLFRLQNDVLTDIETGTRWNFDGKGLEGNLKGASLQELSGIYAFWFAWNAFHPETLIVPGPSVVPDSALETGPISEPSSRQ